MKIGLCSVYSFRPHVEHLAYMAQLLADGDHQLSFLTCDAAVPMCYSRLLRQQSRLTGCLKCMAGGIRGYGLKPVSHIRAESGGTLTEDRLEELAKSTAYARNRIETVRERADPAVQSNLRSLFPGIQAAYSSASKWILREHLDAVICFNGRMDLTRAIITASSDIGIPFLTYERAMFGHGLQIIPNRDCLSRIAKDILIKQFRDVPLTLHQARQAARLMAARFLRQPLREWRAYNTSPTSAKPPASQLRPTVLILPSSQCEVAGHPEWRLDWGDASVAFEELLRRLGVTPGQCLLRCHPNWSQRIGRYDGSRAQTHYLAWARRLGMPALESTAPQRTADLIENCDVVAVSGSSAALEAGMLGRPVVNVGPSFCQHSGIGIQVSNNEQWPELDRLTTLSPDEITRKTLRFMYCEAHRIPQYVRYCRAIDNERFKYYVGGSFERLTRALTSGVLEPDNVDEATNESGENQVISEIRARQWTALLETGDHLTGATQLIQRVGPLRWLDGARRCLPVGDR